MLQMAIKMKVKKLGKSFSSLKQLEQYIIQQINSSLQKEMSEMVKDKISDHVKTDVYDKYPNPVMYKRRGFIEGSLGLGDTGQMNSHLIEDGVLEVVDNADFNHSFAYNHGGYGGVDLGESLAHNIEFGYGNDPWSKPRPFIKNTREEIRDKGLHVQTMKSALKTRGIDVV